MYPYYAAVYRELKKIHNVILEENTHIKDISHVLKKYNISFDCIIFGLGYFAQNSPHYWQKITGLDNLQLPVVAMLHKPQNSLQEKLNFCKINKIDILVDPDITYRDHATQVASRAHRTWFTADPKVFYPRNIEKKYDIGFSGALHGGAKLKGPPQNIRPRVYNLLVQNGSYNMFWNGSDSIQPRISNVDEYATYICQSRAWLSTSGPLNCIGPRYFEVMMSKTLLVCNKMPLQYGDIFIDGKNCLIFENDLSDLIEKLDFYLNNQDELNRLTDAAYDLVVNNYTWKHMAINLIDEVEKLVKAG